MVDWFLERQIKIALLIGSICIPLILVFDYRGFQALAFFLIALALIFCGQKLYASDFSENWVKFSFSDSIKKISGGALMYIGWIILLRLVLALAIASIFLKI